MTYWSLTAVAGTMGGRCVVICLRSSACILPGAASNRLPNEPGRRQAPRGLEDEGNVECFSRRMQKESVVRCSWMEPVERLHAVTRQRVPSAGYLPNRAN
jgi:hypothetical protein